MIYESSLVWYESLAAWRYANLHRYNVRVAVEPTSDLEPITLADCWHQFNLAPWGSPPGTEHDDWFEQLGIPGARAWCEAYLGRSIAEQTLVLATNQFPSGQDYIDLPFGPVQSIESVTYLDEGGNDVIVDAADYQLDTYSEPPRLYLTYDVEWPAVVRDVRNSVRIRYVVGYLLAGVTPNDIPLPTRIRTGMLLLLGHLWKHREDTTTLRLEQIPIGARSFLDWDRGRPMFV